MHPDNCFSKGLVVKMLTLLQKKKKISSYLNTVYSVETFFILLSRGCLLLTSGSVALPFRKFPIKIISHDNWTGVHLQCSSIYIYCVYFAIGRILTAILKVWWFCEPAKVARVLVYLTNENVKVKAVYKYGRKIFRTYAHRGSFWIEIMRKCKRRNLYHKLF